MDRTINPNEIQVPHWSREYDCMNKTPYVNEDSKNNLKKRVGETSFGDIEKKVLSEDEKSILSLEKDLPSATEMVHGLKINRQDYFKESESFRNFLIYATKEGPLNIEFRVGNPTYNKGQNNVERFYFVGEPYNRALFMETGSDYTSDSEELMIMSKNLKNYAKGLEIKSLSESDIKVSRKG